MKEEEVDWTAPLSPRNRNARSSRFDRLGATYCQGRANGMDHADLPKKNKVAEGLMGKKEEEICKIGSHLRGTRFRARRRKTRRLSIDYERAWGITRESGVRTPWRGSDQFESSVEAAP